MPPAVSQSGEMTNPPIEEAAVEGSGGGIHGADPDERTVISQRPPLTPTGAGRPAPPFELEKLLAGERLNHFELREYVGGGGMGAVFRALDTMLNREVALKVLSRDQGADEETRRRFQNEAQSAARLDHENIARVFYVGEDKGLNYIVFEFIEGINLREFVEKKGPLPLAEAISYTLQIADALAHACSRDVVHRDIKPSNVIITEDGRAKLVDMGLARLHQVQPEGEDLTASGVTLGTFDYISPEQARDPRIADVRSDIYSLGCTVYFMLTARPPFPEGTVLQKLLQHNSDAPPDPRELNPELPEELSPVIRKMLAKDPRRRYQHPSELIDDLCLLAEQIGCPTPGPGRMAPWVPAKAPARVSMIQRHLPWIIPVAALLAIVAILDRWQLDDLDQPRTSKPALGRSGVSTRDNRVAGGPLTTAPKDGQSVSSAGENGAEGEVETEDAPVPVSPSADRSSVREETARTGGERDSPSTSPKDPRAASANPAKPDQPLARTSPPEGDRPAGEDASNLNASNPRSAVPSKRVAQEASAVDGAKVEVDDPAKPAESLAPAKTPTEDLPPWLLVVGEGEGPQRYSTLSAACNAAKSGDIIELRYSGPRQEIPITVENKSLSIRAKEPNQPVVAFSPNDADPYLFPHSMLRIVGGSLRLLNVGFEMRLPRGVPSENWTLFEAQRVESLDLNKCTLTVVNWSDLGGAFHDKVSFFHLKASPGADAMMPKGMMAIPPLEIHLQDCLVRGEATFLRDDDAQAVRVHWKNGLLACSEWLLSAAGATTMQTGSTGESGKIHLTLEHLTMALGAGLCRMSNSYSAPILLEVDIQCSDSVVLAASDHANLVEQACIDSPSDAQRRLNWKGDRNVYSGFTAFWKVGDPASASGRPDMLFKNWREYWGDQREVQPSDSPLVWQRPPPAGLPLHQRTAADYTIDDGDNRSLYVTTDGNLVGFNASSLPASNGSRIFGETPSTAAPRANEAPNLD